MYEGQREQLYQQAFNLENAAFAAQNIKDNITQVQAMKAAHKDFKKAFKAKELDIDYVDNMQDDMMDLMDELDALELELGEEETEGGEAEPSYLQEPDLPSAPTGEYAQEEGQAEDQQQNEPLAVNQS